MENCLDLASYPFEAWAPNNRAKTRTCCFSLHSIFFCDFLSFFDKSVPSSSFKGVLTTRCGWYSWCVVSEILAGLDHVREWVAWAQRRFFLTAWWGCSTPSSHPELSCRADLRMLLPTLPVCRHPRQNIHHVISLWFLAICSLQHVSHPSLSLFLDAVHRLPQLIPQTTFHGYVHIASIYHTMCRHLPLIK